jgi:hypothetical protein
MATFPPCLDTTDKDVCLRGLAAPKGQVVLIPSGTLGSSFLGAPAVKDYYGHAVHWISRRSLLDLSRTAAGSPMQESVDNG